MQHQSDQNRDETFTRCPWCSVETRFFRHAQLQKHVIAKDGGNDAKEVWFFQVAYCSKCDMPVVRRHCMDITGFNLSFRKTAKAADPGDLFETLFDSKVAARQTTQIWPDPRPLPMQPASPEVPPDIAEDYNEACAVLHISEKSAAMLARRVLEGVLQGAGGAPAKAQLTAKIDHVRNSLPPSLAKRLDSIKEIGNFACHPRVDPATGDVFRVEPGEAEYALGVLQLLFDHYYVRPAALDAQDRDLELKLARFRGKKPPPDRS